MSALVIGDQLLMCFNPGEIFAQGLKCVEFLPRAPTVLYRKLGTHACVYKIRDGWRVKSIYLKLVANKRPQPGSVDYTL